MTLSITPAPKSGFTPLDTDFNADLESDLGELILTNEPFPDDISSELGSADFTAEAGGNLTFGNDDVVKLSLAGNNEVKSALLLKRSATEKLGFLDEYLPKDLDFDNHLVLALTTTAEAGISANASAKLGSYISISGGSKVTGGLGYHRCLAYPRDQPATEILTDFLGSLRWPLSSAGSHQGLSNHDIAAVEFRGKLELWGEVGVGYSVSGSKGISVKDLEATFNYQLQAAVRLGGKFAIGGNYLLVSSPGEKADWVRLRVKRGSMRSASVEFGIDLSFSYDTTGIPDTADGLLTALTGYDTSNVLKWIETAADAEDVGKALDMVKEKFGEKAKESLNAMMDTVFKSQNFQNLQKKLADVIARYGEFKEEVDARLLDIARKHINSAEIKDTLKDLLARTTREGLSQVSDSETWKLIDDLVGDEAYKLLLDQSAFTDFRSKTQKLLDLLEGKGTYKPLKEFIEELEGRYDVDKLVAKLSDGLDEDKLREIVNGKMGELTTVLFDFAKSELNGSGVDLLVQRVSQNAKDILDFKKKLDERLKKGLKNKLELSILQSSSSSNTNSTLLDMEFNLATSEGRDLFDEARTGDFVKALKSFDPAHVRLHEGEFKQSLVASRKLQVHAFGWSNAFEVDVKQVSTIAPVMQEGGPVFLLNSDTQQTIKSESGFDAKESVQSVLQLGVQARAAAGQSDKDRVLVDVIESMKCSCSVVREQDKPTWDDLPKAFRLAHQLGIVSDPDDTIASLKAELGSGDPQSVKVSYGVSYNPTAFEALWDMEFEKESDGRELVSYHFRRILMDRWSFDHPAFFGTDSQETYLDHYKISPRKMGSVKNKKWRYVVTGNDGKKRVLKPGAGVLYKAYKAEVAFLKALDEVDDAIDAVKTDTTDWNQLNKAVNRFLSVPKNEFSQSLWKGNLFFLTLDTMLIAASGDARDGKTVLQLEITASDGTEVRRFYT